VSALLLLNINSFT